MSQLKSLVAILFKLQKSSVCTCISRCAYWAESGMMISHKLASTLCMLLFSSADFFQINFFQFFFFFMNTSVKCQPVCKGYQHATKVASSKEIQ